MGKVAVIRVRGPNKLDQSMKRTFQQLKLLQHNACRIVEATPAILGMVEKVKDYVTWGEVSAAVQEKLKKQRKEHASDIYLLNSPRKGYGRKGVKVPFRLGGALGYRGEKINVLIERML